MAINCEACDDLRKDAPDLLLNGITDKICENLMKNRGLNPNLSALHNNCEDIKKMIDCFIGGHRDALKAADPCDWKKFIDVMLRNLYVTLEAMGCGDCGQWLEIDKIWAEIKNIYDAIQDLYDLIEAISGAGNSKRLQKGVDYDIKLYNNFYNTDMDLSVRITNTKTQAIIRVGNLSGDPLKHDRLVDIKMLHTDPIMDVPASWMYGIVFKGAYAHLNAYDFRADTSSSNGIWNIRPKTLRASWQGGLGTATDINGYKIFTYLGGYADGYNDQFTVYGDNTMYSPHINNTVYITLVKP